MQTSKNAETPFALQLATVFSGDTSPVFVAVPSQTFDVSIPVQAGLWIGDPGDERGYSGAAVLRIHQGRLYTYAPQSWSVVEQSEEVIGVFVLPLQPAEYQNGTNADAPTKGIVLRLIFERYEFTNKSARVAVFNVVGLEQTCLASFDVVSNAIRARARILSRFSDDAGQEG